MSLTLNQAWEVRLKPLYIKYAENDRINLFRIINQFECNEIYNPNINEREIFEHIYKQTSHEGGITTKRQPNPFMIFRVALGITASRKGIELGDGTSHSKTAGLMWRGAIQHEKKNFETLCSKFRDLHKEMFPGYEYRPKARNPVSGTFVDINNNFGTRIDSNNQSISQQPQISQQIRQIPKDNNATWDQTSSFPSFTGYTAGLDGLDSNFTIGGLQYQLQQFSLPEMYVPQTYVPTELYPTNPLNNEINIYNVEYFQQAPPPSIAENCPTQYFDLNNGMNFHFG
ncbi:unnamed protein product [Rhizophagus irregularis]|uniref:MATA-HMG n=1 Tax=Rhizophagus irregularis TaxID=588596 RepID=A0A2I1G329_9GLOM|nr:hypothetical protein RhiirA4_441046 [Rhizophagus irregularis]CAB4416384.1 unnamed protein product [Rhizophagus irregularis]CAB4417131.1 unnamed protein product [Rhizophagus irregularis]